MSPSAADSEDPGILARAVPGGPFCSWNFLPHTCSLFSDAIRFPLHQHLSLASEVFKFPQEVSSGFCLLIPLSANSVLLIFIIRALVHILPNDLVSHHLNIPEKGFSPKYMLVNIYSSHRVSLCEL